ncbi:MAG TPA: ABC transporter permease [Steroidobacteraceae bacterium]|nr:ABC transporter permease [Steroidobacteraceae bacterium]
MWRKIGYVLSVIVAAVVPVIVLVVLPAWGILAGVVLLIAWLALTRTGRQAWSATAVAVSTIPQRLGSSSVVIIGIAGVVGVLVALLAMAEGFRATLQQTGSDDTAIVLRAGSQTEINSVVDHDSAVLVADMPQVMRDKQNRPIASPEIVVAASIPKKSNGVDSNVEIRGVGDEAWELNPRFRMVTGRRFRSGLRELIVGKDAVREFAHTDMGSTLDLNNQPWTVVGVFDSGDSHNSELWADTGVVATTYHRGSSTSSVTVRLRNAGVFDAFRAAIKTNPQLKLEVQTTRRYYDAQSEGLTRIIHVLGTTVAVIMGIGALFGALNTMYAAIATRTREIATLRAIGFRGAPVVVSVLLETLLLAVLGGIVGAAIAWLLFDHYTASTLGANFSQVVFEFRVTPTLVATGIKWALAIGFLGGLFPALRAARMPVTEGLREL